MVQAFHNESNDRGHPLSETPKPLRKAEDVLRRFKNVELFETLSSEFPEKVILWHLTAFYHRTEDDLCMLLVILKGFNVSSKFFEIYRSTYSNKFAGYPEMPVCRSFGSVDL